MLVDEKYVVLEASIEMRFQAQFDDDRVVVAVDVGIDAVQALEHISDEGGEGLWKGNADAARKVGLVVYVCLNPGHEVLDIFGSRHLGWFLKRLVILPQIFEPFHSVSTVKLEMQKSSCILVCSLHLRTALWRAKFSDGAIEKIDLVVEVDHCYRLAHDALIHRHYKPFTASHSSLSSPSGSFTAFLRLPLPSVASAYCLSCQLLVPLLDFCGLNGARCVRGLLE